MDRRPVLVTAIQRLVDRVLQAFSSLELRLLRGWDLNLLTRARVAANRGLAIRYAKGAESDQTDFRPRLQRFGDGIENRVNGTGRIRFAKAGIIGNGCNKIVLVQGKAPL